MAALFAAAAPALAQTVTLTTLMPSVTNTGTIQGTTGGPGVAVFGVKAGSITNSGTIAGSTAAGETNLLYGVYVGSGGGLSGGVTNSGLITGPNAGINIVSASTVANIMNTGTISSSSVSGIVVNGASVGTIANVGPSALISAGGFDGIAITNGASAAGIVNGGTITGFYDGIYVNGTGSILSGISNSGLINGGSFGVSVENGGAIGPMLNSGTISGGQAGINVGNGGTISSISNASSGVIKGTSSSGIGIRVSGGLVGSISNSGLLYGNNDAINVNGTATITSIVNSGQINAHYSAIGVYQGAHVGSIVNTGSITAGNSSDGISVYQATIGSISNSGVLSGGYAGIQLNQGTLASLSNSGTLSGTQTYGFGVLLQGGSRVTGGITNSGVISGGRYSVFIESGSNVAGGITNSGTISGGQLGLFLASGATVTGGITNSGSIAGLGNGIQISAATVAGAIVNQAGGVISSNGTGMGTGSGAALYVTNAVVGSIQNSGTITSRMGAGILLAGTTISSIQNSGTIEGVASAGLYVAFGTTVSSGITNSGVIKSTDFSGLIEIYSTVTGGIHNAAGGVISGASGVSLYGSTADNIVNDAGAQIIGIGNFPPFSQYYIQEAGIGLRAESTITGSIVNAGLIDGITFGIAVGSEATAGLPTTSGGTIVGGITNSGSLAGGSDGIFVNAGGVLGNVTNLASGSIYGGSAGIALLTGAAVTNGITNAGTITGGTAGVRMVGSTLTGALVNSGSIESGSTGVSVKTSSTITGGLANSGTIAGSKYALNVDATSTIGPITISGNNTAAFVGDVLALNSPVTVASGTFTGTNAFNVQSFDVAQGATLNMGVMASTAGEANGITVSNGVSNEGTLSVARNTANINGSYTQAASGALGVGVVSNTNHGVLAVSGAANLSPAANIIVDIASNNTLTNKETIAGVLTSGALTASTFNVTDNSDLIAFKGLVDGNNVDLVTSFNALVLPDVLANKNVNAVGAATVLDQIILSSGGGNTTFDGIINDIAKLQTTRQVSNAASQTLPVLSGDVTVATYAAMSQMNQVVQSRVAGNYGMSAGSPYTLDQNAWVKPFGSWANAGNQNGAPGFTSNVEGVALGGDAAISNAARVGLAFAYGNVDVSGNASSAPNNDRINMYQLMGYGSYAIDPQTEVNAQIDGGINSNDGHRNIEFAGTNATSSFNSSDAHIGIGIARSLPLSDATVFTPEVRVDYTWISTDDYSEGGAGPLSLNTKSTSFESLLTSINGKLTQKFNDNLTLFGNFGFGYDSMAHTNTSVVAAFSGAPGLSFSTQGIGLSPRAILGGIGLVSTAHGNMPELTFRYDLQQREGFADQSLSFKARWAF